MKKSTLNRILPYALIVLMVVFALWFQMSHQLFLNGTDTFFHMAVTYDTYAQIKHLNFSYFLSAFGFNHSLRIVNAVYGPLGGYLSGLILLLTGNWLRWQIATLFIVLTVTGISMYQLCRYWRVTRVVSVLVSYLYTFSFPIISFWFNTQYDGLGAALIPWVILLGSRILNHERFSMWKATLLLVVLAEIHVFSFLLAGLVLTLCFIMSLFTGAHRMVMLGRLIKLLILTLLLTANVWGAILEVLGSNGHKIIPTYSFTNMFQNIWSCIRYVPGAPLSQNLKLLGLSGTVLVLLIVILYVLRAGMLNRQLNFIMITLGIGFFWLSSRWFPWDALQKRYPILSTDLQFPKRFLPVSLAALLLTLGALLSNLPKHARYRKPFYVIAVLILCIFVGHSWQNMHNQYLNDVHQNTSLSYYQGPQFRRSTGEILPTTPTRRGMHGMLQSLQSTDLNRYFSYVTKPTPDYLPTNHNITTDAEYHATDGYSTYERQVVNNQGMHLHYHLSHHVMRVTFDRPARKPVILPLVKYAHTKVTMNHKSLKHPTRTNVGALQIKPRTGRNVMTFKYVSADWYTALMWLSVVVWLMFVVDIGMKIRNRSVN